ncbi:GntR family transcriptional regulator [Caballeronia choica]|jgi:GntR family transcriptional regulator/MocR family aminotransferase|uniref:GntR family transcriptional regulator n=1 Tax=Caballeronia choica TaxID=326476 RepID=A0A158L1R3_9BURK|nr:hypothetical protein [Caballeronia choica]SAL87324.1 GntR family transcriptional regulator [Caballeronia choica]
MHLVSWLNQALDNREVAALVVYAGAVVRAMSPMFSAGNWRLGLAPGFGGFSGEKMKAAVRRLAGVIACAMRELRAQALLVPSGRKRVPRG